MAIKINPNSTDADAHVYLALAYRRQGKLDKAIAAYEAAIRINPNFIQAHAELGEAYRGQGSIAQLRIAIRMNPDLVWAHVRLGHAYQEHGDINKATIAYTKALSVDTEDNQSRLIAAEELVRIDKSEVNFVASVLIAGLANENEQIRSDSAWALGAICASAEDAIPALVKALNDKVVDVRVNAAGALASIDKSKLNLMMPILIEALKNTDSSVAGSAIVALTQIDEPAKQVVPALVNVLNDEDEDVNARLAVTRALGSIGDSTAVPALVKALNDEDFLIQTSAYDALKTIGTPEALGAVEECEVKWGLR